MRAAACQCSGLTLQEEIAPVAGAEKTRRADPDSNLPGSPVSSGRAQIRSVLPPPAARRTSSACSIAAAPAAAASTSARAYRGAARDVAQRAGRRGPVPSAGVVRPGRTRPAENAVDVLAALAVDHLPGPQVALGAAGDLGDRRARGARWARPRAPRGPRSRRARAPPGATGARAPPRGHRPRSRCRRRRSAAATKRSAAANVTYTPQRRSPGTGEPSRVQARDHLERAAALEHAAVGRRPQPRRQLARAAGREAEAARLRARDPWRSRPPPSRRPTSSRRGTSRTSARSCPRLLRRQPVVLPDGRGRDLVVGRQVLGALARADDLEAAQPRPLHQLADQRGLVAVGERVDDAGGLRRAARAAGRRARRPRR